MVIINKIHLGFKFGCCNAENRKKYVVGKVIKVGSRQGTQLDSFCFSYFNAVRSSTLTGLLQDVSGGIFLMILPISEKLNSNYFRMRHLYQQIATCQRRRPDSVIRENNYYLKYVT